MKNVKMNDTHRDTLTCIYTNAQSIVNKHYELQAIVDTYNPDIIGVTETWLNAKISDT